MPSPSALDSKLSLYFLCGMGLLIPVFKLLSTHRLGDKISDRSRFYRLAPVMTPAALRRARPATALTLARTLARLALGAAALRAAYLAYAYAVARLPPSPLLWGYLAAPIVYLWGETASPIAELLFFPTGRMPSPVHAFPPAASSLADFWGSRWNTWTRDFFFTNLAWPLRRRPTLALAAVFLFSGVLHECLINGLLLAVTGRNLVGTQLAYFTIQGMGVWIDRKYLYRSPRLRRLFLWVVVLVPAPLIANEGLLRILQLWPAG